MKNMIGAVTAFALGAAVALGQEEWKPVLGVVVGGVAIEDVEAKGPGDQAGLRAGDVMMSIDDQGLTDVGDVIRVLQAHAAGGTIEIVVERAGKPITCKVKLIPADGRGRMGVTPIWGARVSSLRENSAALRAGVRKGDVILYWDVKDVEGLSSLRDQVKTVAPGQTVALTLMRDAKEIEVPVQFGKPNGPPSALDRIFDFGKGIGLPGRHDLGALLDPQALVGATEAMAEHLEFALEVLKTERKEAKNKRLDSAIGAIEEAMKHLNSIVRPMRKLQGSMGALRGQIDRFGGAIEDFRREGLVDRLEELMDRGMTMEKIAEIFKREFPGVDLKLDRLFPDSGTPVKPLIPRRLLPEKSKPGKTKPDDKKKKAAPVNGKLTKPAGR